MVTEQHDQYCFCDIDSETIWLETESGRAVWDGFPISKGHTLVVPKFHIPSFHDLDSETQAALWELVGEVRKTSSALTFHDAIEGVPMGGQIGNHHVSVGLQRDLRGGMAEHLGDNGQRDRAGVQEQRSRRVPGMVESSMADLQCSQRLFPRAEPEFAPSRWGSICPREYPQGFRQAFL